MKKYNVWLRLETTVKDIWAKDEDDAFYQAVDIATDGAYWENEITEIEEEEEDY